MKKIVVIVTFFISIEATAQTNCKIEIKRDFFGYSFHQDSTDLWPRDVLQVMEVNQEAFLEFKKARANHAASIISSVAGGFLISFPVGQAIAGNDAEWGLAAGGVVALLGAHLFERTFKKRATNAIRIYNGESVTSYAPKLDLRLSGAGIQLCLKF